MNIRKDRRHLCGSSNGDFKALKKSDAGKPEMMGRIDYLSLPAMHIARDLHTKREKQIQTALNPLEHTSQYYMESNKSIMQKAILDRKRKHHLEEIGKFCFEGSSNMDLDPHFANTTIATRFSKSMTSTAPKIKNLTKQDINARSIVETQQVTLPQFKIETKASQVDLKKVRDVRRAIRRRYANSKNFQKIFSRWDCNNSGSITLQNMYDMCRKMGLDININETKILLASSDKNRDGKLNLNEFQDLIFNDYNVLNMKFDEIPYNDKEIFETQNLEKFMNDDAVKAETRKHKNLINQVLKNNLKNLKNLLLKEDIDSTGTLNQELFNKVMNRLGINKKIVTQEDSDYLFERYRGNTKEMSYQDLVSDLSDFKFDPEALYAKKSYSFKKSFKKKVHIQDSEDDLTFSKLMDKMKNKTFDNQIRFIDNKTQPINYLEKSFDVLLKARRTLRDFFPTKKDFMDYIKKSHKKILEDSKPTKKKPKADETIDTIKLDNNLNDSKDQTFYLKGNEIRDMIDTLMKNINLDLTDREHEHIQSSFDMNKKGDLNAEEVVNILYENDDKDYIMRIQKNPKGPPPNKNEQNISGAYESLESKRLKKLLIPPFNPIQKNLKEIQRTIDEKMLIDDQNFFEKFSSFDKDLDGYVSMNDVRQKLITQNLLNDKECETFVDYLDKEKKGFINFDEFNRKIKRNMANIDEFGKEINVNITTPNHYQVKKLVKDAENYRGTIKAAHDAIKPEKHQYLNQTSRYGSTPPWRNTFINFQPPKESPQFILEKDRLVGNSQTRTSYQWDDKFKRESYSQGRVRNIQTHNNFFHKKIIDHEDKLALKESSKLQKKGAQQLFYEHVNHLKNKFY